MHVIERRFAEDLDADSLDLVELVMALEETFDVSVEETELEGIETIGQAFDLIWQAYQMIVFIRAADSQIPPLRAVDGAGFAESSRSTASH